MSIVCLIAAAIVFVLIFRELKTWNSAKVRWGQFALLFTLYLALVGFVLWSENWTMTHQPEMGMLYQPRTTR
jgi:hypothetical protein